MVEGYFSKRISPLHRRRLDLPQLLQPDEGGKRSLQLPIEVDFVFSEALEPVGIESFAESLRLDLGALGEIVSTDIRNCPEGAILHVA